MAAGVALLLLAGYVADGQLRHRELTRLLGRIEAAQATATYADNRVAATAQYASPLLTSADVTPNVRRGLEQLVEQAAAGQVPAVQRSVASIELPVLPWHHDVRTARDRYQSYAAHRLGVLRAGATDIRALGTPHPELARELAAVRSALTAAGASPRQVDAALGRP